MRIRIYTERADVVEYKETDTERYFVITVPKYSTIIVEPQIGRPYWCQVGEPGGFKKEEEEKRAAQDSK